MSIERRHKERLDCSLQAHIQHRGRCFSARIRNISADGVCLQTSSLTVPNGILVGMEFDSDNVQWQLPGLVVRHQRGGLGIAFKTVQPALFEQMMAQTRRVPSSPGSESISRILPVKKGLESIQSFSRHAIRRA
ncbi:MAG: PilZ domain-containing protein [Gammaproteobacteria bacterium]|nr:PilZ domain-containing protein [Gammaproteobacteria bacterium]